MKYLATNDKKIFEAVSRALILAKCVYEVDEIKDKIVPPEWYETIDAIDEAWRILSLVKED